MWQEINDFIRAAGYEDRDEDTCKSRIHTLVSAYRSYVQRRMREDRKRNSEEEAGVLRRSRLISLKKTT